MTRRDLIGAEPDTHHQRLQLTPSVLMVFTALMLTHPCAFAEPPIEDLSPSREPHALRKRINFTATWASSVPLVRWPGRHLASGKRGERP
jgi:hypothetical protein